MLPSNRRDSGFEIFRKTSPLALAGLGAWKICIESNVFQTRFCPDCGSLCGDISINQRLKPTFVCYLRVLVGLFSAVQPRSSLSISSPDPSSRNSHEVQDLPRFADALGCCVRWQWGGPTQFSVLEHVYMSTQQEVREFFRKS